MQHPKRSFFLAVVLLGLTWPALATDGYFSIAYATRHKGMAGAGLGFESTTLIGGNPATRSFLGARYNFNLGLFSPARQYSVTGNPSGQPNSFGLAPGTFESGSTVFILPSFGANWPIGEKAGLGVAVYGNGGMNSDYDTRTFGDASAKASDGFALFGKVTNLTGVNLAQLFTEASFAYQVAEGHSLGVSAVFAYQNFEAKGLATFAQASGAGTKLSNNEKDNSTGFGFKVGYLGRFSDLIAVGATYQSKTAMGEFEEYAGLFAEGGDFDIPSWFGVGIALSPSEKVTFLADYKRINYSGVKSINNPMVPQNLFPAFLKPGGVPTNPNDYLPNPAWTPLGSENAAGFGWKDMNIFKVGIEFSGVENWVLRGGYSYGKQPIPESEVLFNILAPGVVEHHIALGFSRKLGGESMLDFSLNLVPANALSGKNPLDPGQTIELKMGQLDFQFGITF